MSTAHSETFLARLTGWPRAALCVVYAVLAAFRVAFDVLTEKPQTDTTEDTETAS